MRPGPGCARLVTRSPGQPSERKGGGRDASIIQPKERSMFDQLTKATAHWADHVRPGDIVLFKFPVPFPQTRDGKPGVRPCLVLEVDDLGEDAARQTRAASEAIAQLPYEALKSIQSWARDLEKHSERRRFLTDDYRHAARSALRELARLDPELAPGLIDSAMRNLRDALEAAHRVADLLAAEQEIARSRGLPS